MTSTESDSVATILCTCKQTRFNIGTPNYRELDIEGLDITVSPSAKSGTREKRKGKSEGIEILNNAKLRLKAGQRYALIGRNGTGKSTLLKAIAEKLIPGIPEETRIVLLQQTNITDGNFDEPTSQFLGQFSKETQASSVLEEVIERATSRGKVEKEISSKYPRSHFMGNTDRNMVLSSGINSKSPYGALRALRQILYEHQKMELFLKDKDARLRSGARGLQARKALRALEKGIERLQTLLEEKDETITADTLAKETAEASDMLAELGIQLEPSKLAETESRARKILTGLGFSEACTQTAVSSLSGGWRMRASLAAALLQDADILILDEPTNSLDLFGIIWLQRFLTYMAERTNPPTLIMVSHDRHFISLCTDLLIIKDKDLTYFHGDLPLFESSRAEKKTYLLKMKEAKDKQKEHIQQTINRNMREGKSKDDQNRIRQTKSRQKKLDDRWGLEVGINGGRFKLNRDLTGHHLTSRAEIDIPQEERIAGFFLPEAPDLRFPGPLLSLERVSFRYPSSKKAKTPPPLVLQDINLSVHMGDRIGIFGLNGEGKSTLIKILVEESKPTSGYFTTHPRLKIGYYSQSAVDKLQRMGLTENDLTSLGLLNREVSGELVEGELRGLLGSFGLPGRLASDVPICQLSGGQLVRLEMARILWKCPHCLVLDEITTHLDYETVTAMREALRNWDGAVVLVSHDRWFMRDVVEGFVDEDDSNASEDEDKVRRRRLLYRLTKGKLTVLKGGVQEFEDDMEKKVRKLMKS